MYIWHLWGKKTRNQTQRCVQRTMQKLIPTVPLAAGTSTLNVLKILPRVYAMQEKYLHQFANSQCFSPPSISAQCKVFWMSNRDFREESPSQGKHLGMSDPTGSRLGLLIPTLPEPHSLDLENCTGEAFSDPAFKWLICTMFC